MSAKRERPDALAGDTQRVDTGWGKVYVTVNYDEDGEPFEAFVATGQSGGYVNSWAEALGKTVSNALRSGADIEEVANDLIGIRSDRVATDCGDTVLSIPDAVGIALRRAARGEQGESVIEGDRD